MVRTAGTWADGYTDNIDFRLTHLADLNRDGCINEADLCALIVAFGQTGERPEDLNGNRVVDDGDLAKILFNFGVGC